MRLSSRVAASSLVATAATLLLCGCFMRPLLDNRSPFDDASNASRAEIAAAVPAVQDALDDITGNDPAWRAVAETGSDDCEGACNLHVQVSIEPDDLASLTAIERPDLIDNGFTRYAVPEEVLAATLRAAVPVAEQYRVDVSVVPGLGDSAGDVDPVADLSDAVEGLFAGADGTPGFAVGYGESTEGWVKAFTRTSSDVLTQMGLG